MKSADYMNKIKDSLEDVLDNIDDSYTHMEAELRKEIISRKEKMEKVDKETKDIYNILTKEICEKLIKKVLPWRIKIFNKIEWAGQGITSNGSITIWFNFNKHCSSVFAYKFDIGEIKRLLKLDVSRKYGGML